MFGYYSQPNHTGQGAAARIASGGNRPVKNNLYQNITLISPVSAGLLNVSEKPPEDSKSKCFEWKNSTLFS